MNKAKSGDGRALSRLSRLLALRSGRQLARHSAELLNTKELTGTWY